MSENFLDYLFGLLVILTLGCMCLVVYKGNKSNELVEHHLKNGCKICMHNKLIE